MSRKSDFPWPRSLRSKMLIFGCGIAFFTALFISLFNYHRTSQIAYDSAISELAGETRLTALHAQAAYAQMMNDVSVISGTPPIAGIMRSIRSGGNDPLDGSTIALWNKRLAMIFTALIKSRPHYTQIRYIGVADNGRELVRVNRSGAEITTVSAEKLQSKSDEDYFQKGLKLKPGEIYFSDITLNREWGQLDLTATPTLRAITPIYDEKSNYFGMVVINADYYLFMRNILYDLKSNKDIYIINHLGDYTHKNKNNEISSLQRVSLPHLQVPDFIKEIRSTKETQSEINSDSHISYFIRTTVNPLQPDYYISTALLASKEQLFENANYLSNETIALGFILIVAASVIAAMLSNRFTKPISDMTREVALFDLEGKAPINLPVNAQDEVGKLAKTFEEMAHRLQQSYATQNKLSIQLNAFIQNAVDGFIAIDETGIIEQVNPAALAMLGYEEHELIGENIAILMQEPVHSKHDHYLRQYRETGKQTVIGKISEQNAVCKDGRIIPVAISTSEIQLDDRRIFTGILRDISALKRKEADLRESEETFRLALHNAPVGMALVSLSGKFLEVNSSLSTFLGYDAAELVNLTFQELTHPDDLEADLENVHNVLAGGTDSYVMEKRYITKSGAVLWAQQDVSLVRAQNGSPRYFISQIQDINARKEMEQMKDEFVSVVSHELRTPLTSIRGALGLIIGAMSKDIPERVTDLLTIAHKSSERLILLINDILDMEKITSGKMQFNLAEQDLKEVVTNAISANKAYADQFGVNFIAHLPDDEMVVRADEARLIQVISNLLSNAAKFTPSGANIDIRLERQGTSAKLSVQDCGPGIPEQFRSQIFQRFSQADSSTTREKGGTGLGLHISKEMIEKMGGSIDFESIQGQGATFWLTLPLKKEARALAAPAATAAANEIQQYGQSNIYPKDFPPIEQRRMVVLDELKMLAGAADRLQQAGFNVEIVNSKEQVLDTIGQEAIDVLVITLAPESQSNAEILEALRSAANLASTPILIIPGRGQSRLEQGDATLLHDVRKLLQLAYTEDWPLDGHKKAALPLILHVEDDTDFSTILASALHDKAVLANAPTLREARAMLDNNEFALIVLDIALPDGNGLDLLKGTKIPSTPILVLSANELPAPAANISTALVKSRQSERQLVEIILAMVAKHAKADEVDIDDRKTQSYSVH